MKINSIPAKTTTPSKAINSPGRVPSPLGCWGGDGARLAGGIWGIKGPGGLSEAPVGSPGSLLGSALVMAPEPRHQRGGSENTAPSRQSWDPGGSRGRQSGAGGGSDPSHAASLAGRNFARGSCRWGQSCRFSHDRKSVHICKYFQRGFCSYGEQCRVRPWCVASAWIGCTRSHCQRSGSLGSSQTAAMRTAWAASASGVAAGTSRARSSSEWDGDMAGRSPSPLLQPKILPWVW
uniref:RING-type E3 ubiquitin transferase n=1 Tax=Accipiter nisus TaxID=211598 RepID=A0A8B9RYZ8_9AVES